MATVTKTFTFDSSIESWTGVPNGAVTMTRITTDGSPTTGCLQARLAGKNQNPSTSYWKWIGTWESLGVPSGATVQSIGVSPNNDYNWRCSEWDTGTGTNAVGPFEVYDNTPTLLGTFSAQQTSVTGTTSWATANGAAVSISNQASTATIQLWISIALRTGNSNGAFVALLVDQVVLEIQYTVSTPTLTAAQQTYTLTPYASALKKLWKVISTQATYTITAYDVSMGKVQKMSAAQATYTLTPYDVALKKTYKLTAEQATYTLTQYDSNFSVVLGGLRGAIYGLDMIYNAFPLALLQGDASVDLKSLDYIYVAFPLVTNYQVEGTPTLTAQKATYTLTAYATNLKKVSKLTAAQATYTITQYDVTFTKVKALQAEQATYAVTQYDVALKKTSKLTASQQSYSVTPYDSTLKKLKKLTAEQQTYAVTPYAVNLKKTKKLSCEQTTYVISTYDISLKKTFKIVCEQATYSITAYDAILTGGKTLTADYQTYSVTAYSSALKKTSKLVCEQATFTVTAYDTGLAKGFTLTADYRTYSITAYDVSWVRSYILHAAQATYTVTPFSAILSKTGIYKLEAAQASYTITPYDVSLKWKQVLHCAQASFTVTAYDVTFKRTYNLQAEYQTYTITQYDVGLSKVNIYKLTADFQTYTVTAYDVSLDWNRVLPASQTTYSFTPNDTSLKRIIRLNAEAQTYTITSYDVGWVYDRVLNAETQTYLITPYNVALSKTGIFKMNANYQTYGVTFYDSGLYKELKLTASQQSYTVTAYGTGIKKHWLLTNQKNATAVAVNVGTIQSGDVDSTRVSDDIRLVINEIVAVNPAFEVEFKFIDIVDEPMVLNIEGFYEGNPAHNVKLKIYNRNTLNWDNITTNTRDLPSASSDQYYAFNLPTLTDYLDSGEIRIRISHDSVGSAGHTLNIDRINLSAVTKYAFSANDSGLFKKHYMPALKQDYTITFNDSNILFNRVLYCLFQAYTLTLFDTGLYPPTYFNHEGSNWFDSIVTKELWTNCIVPKPTEFEDTVTKEIDKQSKV